MNVLNEMQMYELSEVLMKEFADGALEKAISSLNRAGKLADWLEMMGLSQLLGGDIFYNPKIYGKILVLGDSRTNKRHLTGVAKSMGFAGDRFEFSLTMMAVKNITILNYAILINMLLLSWDLFRTVPLGKVIIVVL